MTFRNRWCIGGTLQVLSPLHLGCGLEEVIEHSKLKKNSQDQNAADTFPLVKRIITDKKGRPILPGSTLKGAVRGWLDKRFANKKDRLDALFGTEQLGGKLEFLDAFLSQRYHGSNPPGVWFPDRQTGVDVSVSIDRKTRSASHEKLFHQEYVPPGVEFALKIYAQDVEDDDIALVISGLLGFGDLEQEERIVLGGDGSHDYGRLAWRNPTLEFIDREGAASWVRKTERPVWSHALQPVSKSRYADLMALGNRLFDEAKPTDQITITIQLVFSSPFLVNDPTRVNASKKPEDDEPDQRPRINHDAKLSSPQAYFPAKSFRGPLRAQAERIYRTLLQNDGAVTDNPHLERPQQYHLLEPPARLFGATGWAGALSVRPIKTLSPSLTRTQHFVAIDRFTGGGAHGRKFATEAFYPSEFLVQLDVDPKRAGQAALGLLILTLRDLQQGDIRFGYGSAKGYGVCHVEKINLPDKAYTTDCLNAFYNAIIDLTREDSYGQEIVAR